MTGVEGWPIHGRLPKRRDDFAEARAAANLLEAANRTVGLTDISDSTVRRIAEYLHRDDT